MNLCSCGQQIKRSSKNCPTCSKLLRRRNSYVSPAPYAGFLTALPYIDPANGRRIVRYTDALGKKRSTSLARYLMSLHLGYIPDKSFDVDHIDQDPTNDCISNLQLISKFDNLSKGSSRSSSVATIRATCVVCGSPVTKRGRISYFPLGSIFSCSRSCSGHISHLLKATPLCDLLALNNAQDTDVHRETTQLVDRILIGSPSLELKLVLDTFLTYGMDFY